MGLPLRDGAWKENEQPAPHVITPPSKPSSSRTTVCMTTVPSLDEASSAAPSAATGSYATTAPPHVEAPQVGPLAVFWDIENCGLPADVAADDVASNIRSALRNHPATAGRPVTALAAYADFSLLTPRVRQGCQRTGINLIDVPHSGKDAADKAILADLFLFALDNPPPLAILLISSDVDFAHALQKLSQRNYTVLLAVLGSGNVSRFLTSAAEHVWDWRALARGNGLVTVEAAAQQAVAERHSEPSARSQAYRPSTHLESFLEDGLVSIFTDPQDSVQLPPESQSLPEGVWVDAFQLLYQGGWE